MNYTIIPYTDQYLNDLKTLADQNKDVLKPNTKMLYYIVARLFSEVSFVAMDNDTVIGFVVSFKNDIHVWLHQLAVDQKYRGKGIAKALIHKLEAACTNSTIAFSVKEDNYSAIALYENLGYKKAALNTAIEQIIYSKTIDDRT